IHSPGLLHIGGPAYSIRALSPSVEGTAKGTYRFCSIAVWPVRYACKADLSTASAYTPSRILRHLSSASATCAAPGYAWLQAARAGLSHCTAGAAHAVGTAWPTAGGTGRRARGGAAKGRLNVLSARLPFIPASIPCDSAPCGLRVLPGWRHY